MPIIVDLCNKTTVGPQGGNSTSLVGFGLRGVTTIDGFHCYSFTQPAEVKEGSDGYAGPDK